MAEAEVKCKTCSDSGYISITCPQCDGSGEAMEMCPDCHQPEKGEEKDD